MKIEVLGIIYTYTLSLCSNQTTAVENNYATFDEVKTILSELKHDLLRFRPTLNPLKLDEQSWCEFFFTSSKLLPSN